MTQKTTPRTSPVIERALNAGYHAHVEGVRQRKFVTTDLAASAAMRSLLTALLKEDAQRHADELIFHPMGRAEIEEILKELGDDE